jgi:hypothetical protein
MTGDVMEMRTDRTARRIMGWITDRKREPNDWHVRFPGFYCMILQPSASWQHINYIKVRAGTVYASRDYTVPHVLSSSGLLG